MEMLISERLYLYWGGAQGPYLFDNIFRIVADTRQMLMESCHATFMDTEGHKRCYSPWSMEFFQ